MNDTIYILYDHEKENTESLDEFIKILELAKFDLNKIQPITLDNYIKELNENGFNFHNFVLCINQTYKSINTIYSDKLNVPIFDFFSKEFSDTSKKLVLFGLLFDIKTIYQPAYKRYGWDFILKFKTEYLNIINNIQKEDDIYCDYLNDAPAPSIKVPKTELEIIKPVVTTVEEISPEYVQETPITENTPQALSLSYEELLSFYNNTKNLINLYNTIQNQISLFESLKDE